MALVGFYGSKRSFIGPDPLGSNTNPSSSSSTIDAANEAIICIGYMSTSDEGSHTIDTSGSSSIAWRSAAVTFANAGTTVKVGIAAVDTGAGPPARAVNVTDAVTFDVSTSLVGGGGGITANATQTHVPDAGSKTIAHGDLVAICVQMTARAGADAVNVTNGAISNGKLRPCVTVFLGGSYIAGSSAPNMFVTFADGATGWLDGADIFTTMNTRTWNSGSATKEYGQLFKLPFPTKVYGFYGWMNASADTDVVLYSDPLGTPVAEKTISLDANTVGVGAARRFQVLFPSPYSTTTDQLIGAVFKPGASSIDAYYKTLSTAGHRVADVWGVEGYGISRASGAFADTNSSLDHYYIGLIVGAYDAGGGGPVGQQCM